ncbi:MAG: hypothetical protein HC840_32590 [Leptolyngbyaceae cyanobacterium RM2_2_4]|nr:hypothetical protein [Leptolyngbyaceae cyanobacterium RM2_2_4]
MFEFLCDRVLNDPYEQGTGAFAMFENNPRQIALAAILRNYPDHPQTLKLLRDRATNDPDEQVRKFAKKRLANLER